MAKVKTNKLLDISSRLMKLKYNYTYCIGEYINNKQKIKIKCDKNHIFEMSISQHLIGYTCPFCSGHRKTINQIILDLEEKHGNKYHYPDSFNKINSKIRIMCKLHGEFKQTLKNHLSGNGCPRCAGNKKMSNDEFIEKCQDIDNTLIYTQTNYLNNKQKVNIFCRKHGNINITPNQIFSQQKKYICKKCYSHNKRFNNFMEKSKNKYGEKFEYFEYVDIKTKIKILDKENNLIISQSPHQHINCDYFYNKRDINDFISNSINIHGDKYLYGNSIYRGSKEKILITCKNHGDFEQIVNNHLRGAGCPKCNRFNLKENELFDFIESNYDGDIIRNSRNIISNELDIYLPELKLGFEFNGLYWHSDLYKENYYHLNKSKECLERGIQLIHIWEDDWNHKQDIVKSIILNKLKRSNRIFARKCVVKEVFDNRIVRDFLNKNHIQGFIGSKIKLGLYYDNELVSVMTFGSLRISLGKISKEGSFELLRFCNKLETSVIGGASKLFNYFINNYNYKEIISYSDNSRGQGELYKKIGFKLQGDTTPNYYWVVDGIRKHRFNYRKDKLIREGYDPNKTEVDIMSEIGYYRIFDCGNKKWSFNK